MKQLASMALRGVGRLACSAEGSLGWMLDAFRSEHEVNFLGSSAEIDTFVFEKISVGCIQAVLSHDKELVAVFKHGVF